HAQADPEAHAGPPGPDSPADPSTERQPHARADPGTDRGARGHPRAHARADAGSRVAPAHGGPRRHLARLDGRRRLRLRHAQRACPRRPDPRGWLPPGAGASVNVGLARHHRRRRRRLVPGEVMTSETRPHAQRIAFTAALAPERTAPRAARAAEPVAALEPPAAPILEAREVTKRYELGKTTVEALRGVSM